MASSFPFQIPGIVYLIQSLNPKKILDIGKGFGKYGFLIHEYIGISNTKKVNPNKTMAEQSRIVIDAVEIDADLMMPHLSHFYNHIYFGDILKMYKELPYYDVIFMVDIIEHLDKQKSIDLLTHFLSKGSTILIATPVNYFEQHLYESVYEEHISHWGSNDFEQLGFVDKQVFSDGAVYLLRNSKINIRGFGGGLVKKLRRIFRAVLNELR